VTETKGRLAAVMDKAGLEPVDIARILDKPPRSISRWLNEDVQPRWESRERLLELIYVIERLTQVVTPEASQDWLFTPNAALEHKKPVELLRSGSFKEVLALIDAIGEGVFT
jgi:putative toxin-antitoxin system antitoxin component (TIGR02293 family)